MPLVTPEQRDHLLQQAEQAAQQEARYESKFGDFLVPGAAMRGVLVPKCKKRASWLPTSPTTSPTSAMDLSPAPRRKSAPILHGAPKHVAMSMQDQADRVNPHPATVQAWEPYHVANLREAPRPAPETRRPDTLRGHSFEEEHFKGVSRGGKKKPTVESDEDDEKGDEEEAVFSPPIPHTNEAARPQYATRPGVVRGKSMEEDEIRPRRSLANADPKQQQADMVAAMEAIDIASFSSEEELDEHKLVAKVNPHPTSIRVKHYNPADVPFMPEAPPLPEPTRRPETLRGNSFDGEHGSRPKRGGKKPAESVATTTTRMHASAPNLDYSADDESPKTTAEITRAALLSNRYSAKIDDFVTPGQNARVVPKMIKRDSWVKQDHHHAMAGALSPRKPLW